jgi:hypothetical protein
MSISPQISDYADIVHRAQYLGCQIPSGIAILPRNFATAQSAEELLFESETPTVRVLWRKAGVVETPILTTSQKTAQISEKSFEAWIAPTIFVSLSLLSQNPGLVSVALGVISNYLTDLFKGFTDKRNVRLDIIVETKNKGYKNIHYEGPVDGLKDLPSIVREVGLDEQRGK